jgi:hypothetical protein
MKAQLEISIEQSCCGNDIYYIAIADLVNEITYTDNKEFTSLEDASKHYGLVVSNLHLGFKNLGFIYA